MNDIDWLAVDMVVSGTSLALKPPERKMVIRRLSERMLSLDDWHWSQTSAAKLTAKGVAERMGITERSVQRIKDELPLARKAVCPVCREPMWILLDSGTVEPHGDALFELCPMSGREMLTGLAAIRPELYQWVVA